MIELQSRAESVLWAGAMDGAYGCMGACIFFVLRGTAFGTSEIPDIDVFVFHIYIGA